MALKKNQKSRITFLVLQILVFLLSMSYIIYENLIIVFMWFLFGIAGGIILGVVAAHRAKQIGELRFLLGSITIFIAAVASWVLIVLLFAHVHDFQAIELGGILVFVTPAWALWSTGWFALLRLGPFAVRSKPTKEQPIQ